MKYLFFLLFALNFLSPAKAERPAENSEQGIITDTLVQTYDHLLKKLEKDSSDNESKKSDKNLDESEEDQNTDSNFMSSWKFYVIILAFPVILIGILLLVFVRGRK